MSNCGNESLFSFQGSQVSQSGMDGSRDKIKSMVRLISKKEVVGYPEFFIYRLTRKQNGPGSLQ